MKNERGIKMSTRSKIGIQNKDKSVTSIYCNYDGYLFGVGAMLNRCYQKEYEVRELMELGDIIEIGCYPNNSICHACEPKRSAQTYSTWDEFMDDKSVDYIYLFSPDMKAWYVKNIIEDIPFSLLSAELKLRFGKNN